MQKNVYIKYGVVLIVIVIAGFWYSMARSHMGEEEWKVEEETESGETALSTTVAVSQASAGSVSSPEIYVHVCGAVNNPGVYTGPGDFRVYQFIQMAGGIREDGAEAGLNMARTVSDGEQIYVLTKEEAAKGVSSDIRAEATPSEKAGVPDQKGKVNLNTATENELMTLPGIGSAKAKAILTYRESNGKFTAIEELMNISGIKQATFEQIKGLITVEQ